MSFNMNRTWSEATALVRGNFQLLAIIAGVFLLLPALVLALVMPAPLDWMALGQDPEAMTEAMGAMLGPLLVYGFIAFILQMIGYTAMVALVGEDRPTVGEAISLGLRCLPTIIGATLLFALGYVLFALILSLVFALLGSLLGAVGAGGIAAVLTVVVMLVLMLAVLYMMTRLSLTLPVVVLEGVRNPLTALKRSWQLTRGHGKAIFVFYLLLAIAYVVISLLLVGLASVIGAVLGSGPAAALFGGLVNGLIGALVAMVMSAILVAMHRQLAGGSSAVLSETFR